MKKIKLQCGNFECYAYETKNTFWTMENHKVKDMKDNQHLNMVGIKARTIQEKNKKRIEYRRKHKEWEKNYEGKHKDYYKRKKHESYLRNKDKWHKRAKERKIQQKRELEG